MRALRRSPANGFTLIEVIIVILLLATLAIYSFGFLGLGSDMVIQVNQRNQLVAEQRFAIERLNREIRSSVPRSARADAACLEYMPMIGSNVYLSLPRPGPGGSEPMVVVTPFLQLGELVDNYVLVYATGPNYIYGNNQQRRKLITAVTNDAPQNGLSTLSLSASPAEFLPTVLIERTTSVAAPSVGVLIRSTRRWCVLPTMVCL